MSIQEYLLPDVGEGLTEAEIVSWRVKPGDVIKVNDIVVEIETAKSLVELPSPYAGTVQSLLVDEGVTVAVGTPIIAVSDGSDVGAQSPAQTPTEPLQEEPMKTLVGSGPKDLSTSRRQRKHVAEPVAEAPVAAAAVAAAAAPAPAAGGARPLAKPPVRKLAKDLGIDLASVVGTGPGGVITRGDLDGAQGVGSGLGSGASSPDPAPAAASRPASTDRGERREPIKGVRRMMGQAMVQSAFTIPHVTEWVTVDVTETMRFVERLKTMREFRDARVSPMLVLARSVMLAMRRTPEINAWWDEPAQEIVYKDAVNLGIAAATGRGLVVPNIKDADLLDLRGLADAISGAVDLARDGHTPPADMSGGTFTITNVGVFGVDSGTPIINPGESAIIAFGAVKPQPWVHEDQIAIRQVTTLALSFDHRFIDGAKGSQFLADVAALMEDPATALLY